MIINLKFDHIIIQQ